MRNLRLKSETLQYSLTSLDAHSTVTREPKIGTQRKGCKSQKEDPPTEWGGKMTMSQLQSVNLPNDVKILVRPCQWGLYDLIKVNVKVKDIEFPETEEAVRMQEEGLLVKVAEDLLKHGFLESLGSFTVITRYSAALADIKKYIDDRGRLNLKDFIGVDGSHRQKGCLDGQVLLQKEIADKTLDEKDATNKLESLTWVPASFMVLKINESYEQNGIAQCQEPPQQNGFSPPQV